MMEMIMRASISGGNNGGGGVEPPPTAAVKQISVKRKARGEVAMGCRSAASPHSWSPAMTNVRAANKNQNAHSNKPLSLSRNNSRKTEHSLYRRNPLAEIDQNCIGFEVPLPSNKAANNILSQWLALEDLRMDMVMMSIIDC